MKILKYVAILFLILLGSLCANAKSDLIWDTEDDKFLEEINAPDSPISEEKKVFLEGEIKNVLDIDLQYMNLADCIITAAENSYDLKIKQHELKSTQNEFWAKTAELLPKIHSALM